MSEETATFAPDFKRWADAFPQDARLMLKVLDDEALPADVRRIAAGALQYLLMQMDVIPDHLPVLGVLDDAFVMRVASALIIEQDAKGVPTEIGRLANDDDKVASFLGKDLYGVLRKLVESLKTREIRKRTGDQLVGSEKERRHFTQEIEAQLAGIRPGSVDDPAKMERDVLSYFKTKLVRL